MGVYRRVAMIFLLVLAVVAVPAAGPAQPFANLPYDRLPLDKIPLEKVPFAYSELFVLGNSLSDVGNVYLYTGGLIPAFPYYEGRFSNGPNYTDYLADTFALANDPYLAGGTNFAWGGARTGGEPASGLDQLGQFRQSAQARPPSPDALFIVFLGGNNLRDIIVEAAASPDPGAVVQAGIGRAMADMSAILSGLIEAGARNIAVPNLPNLGRVPAITMAYGGMLVPLAASATQGYNAALEQLLASFDGAARIMRVDVYGLFEAVAAQPAAFGFSNVTDPCLLEVPGAGALVCPNPDEYLFWDLLHPTTAGHMILADEVVEAVRPGLPGRASGR